MRRKSRKLHTKHHVSLNVLQQGQYVADTRIQKTDCSVNLWVCAQSQWTYWKHSKKIHVMCQCMLHIKRIVSILGKCHNALYRKITGVQL